MQKIIDFFSRLFNDEYTYRFKKATRGRPEFDRYAKHRIQRSYSESWDEQCIKMLKDDTAEWVQTNRFYMTYTGIYGTINIWTANFPYASFTRFCEEDPVYNSNYVDKMPSIETIIKFCDMMKSNHFRNYPE